MTTTFDDLPVLAFTADGQYETTLAKATGIDQLAKATRRAEIRAFAREAKEITFARMTKEADTFWRQVHIEKFGERLNKMVRDRHAAMRKAEAESTIAKAKASIAKSKEIQRQATIKANDVKTQLAKRQADLKHKTDELSERIAIVTANYNAGAQRVAAMEARNAARAQQRIADEEADWSAKAAATSDPILKQGYLERAEAAANGETFNND